MLKKLIAIASICVISLMFIGAEGDCSGQPASRVEGDQRNEEIMQRAVRVAPVPDTNNFLTRQSVAKWMERQDTPDRPYYVYIMADTGNFIGYYVAQSRPVNTCSFLTPPDRALVEYSADPVVKNPGLDGVYYGDSGCNQWFFFDASTDAMIELTGLKFFTSDQPLSLEVDPIRIQE